MPRTARLVVPDVALHLVQRGVNREPCFFTEAHYAEYLSLLGWSARRYGCSIHAYCLMTNHVHLLLTPHEPAACARTMKHLNQRYVQSLNRATGRTGTLWEGRFHSSVVASEDYALACYRYIELNPVRAGMVSRAEDYPWSSYRANSLGARDDLLSPHPAYLALSESAGQRQLAYRELCDAPLAPALMEEIRKATRGGYPAGAKRRPRGRPVLKQEFKAGCLSI